MPDPSNPLVLLPPAIIISLSAYLINFFGKAITDQTPFADDRKWNRELEGLFFFAFRIVSPAIGALIFISNNYDPRHFTKNDWILIFIIGIVSLNIIFIKRKSDKFFLKGKTVKDSEDFNLQVNLFNLGTIIIILLMAQYYNWKEYLYIIPSLIFLLMHLLGFALFLSLKKENILIADIYFIDNRKVVRDCRVIKINEDNMRIRKDGFDEIINKSQIFKIKEKIDVMLDKIKVES